jgi:hypothetical protein
MLCRYIRPEQLPNPHHQDSVLSTAMDVLTGVCSYRFRNADSMTA